MKDSESPQPAWGSLTTGRTEIELEVAQNRHRINHLPHLHPKKQMGQCLLWKQEVGVQIWLQLCPEERPEMQRSWEPGVTKTSMQVKDVGGKATMMAQRAEYMLSLHESQLTPQHCTFPIPSTARSGPYAQGQK